MATEEKVILLVEDNPADVKLTQIALNRSGITNRLVVANDGVEALDYLFGTGPYKGREVNPTPAVTLLDLNMPRIDGLEVLRRLRADPRTRMMPVVVMTSSREENDIVNSYYSGCNAYVRKPVNFVEFTRTIHELGQFWLKVNEAPPSRK